MTGRGVDQALAHPVEPTLHEPSVHDARVYFQLAQQRNGPIARPLAGRAIWGDALVALARERPALRLVNLETAITTSDQWRREKGIHYRMHPENMPCLTAAGIDGCTLANNHVLDWDYPGLMETLVTLRRAGIHAAGAGANGAEAAAPMTFHIGSVCVHVFAFGCGDSGIPPSWAATVTTPGVNFLPALDDAVTEQAIEHIHSIAQPNDLIVISIHWGENWGHEVPPDQRRFAHRLIDADAADLVCGHSSHHPKAIEVYQERLVLYGCGDLIDDYEGITGQQGYRPDLRLMYLPTLEATTGRLVGLRMIPFQSHRLQLRRATRSDSAWLVQTLGQPITPARADLHLTTENAIELVADAFTS